MPTGRDITFDTVYETDDDDREYCRICGGNYMGVAVFHTGTERLVICVSCAKSIVNEIDPADPVED